MPQLSQHHYSTPMNYNDVSHSNWPVGRKDVLETHSRQPTAVSNVPLSLTTKCRHQTPENAPVKQSGALSGVFAIKARRVGCIVRDRDCSTATIWTVHLGDEETEKRQEAHLVSPRSVAHKV